MNISGHLISDSESATAEFAADMASRIMSGTVLALYGTLGAGKSVFSRGFARGCGITGAIPSPTFTIIQEYATNGAPNGIARLYHMDLYRIADSNAALAFGIDEYLYDTSAVKLIEWPERIKDILPDNTLRIDIAHISENSREITIASLLHN